MKLEATKQQQQRDGGVENRDAAGEDEDINVVGGDE
jgi:hypothetical protein